VTLDQIIAVVGHTATWLTLIVVLLTLREMNTQRRHSYKPQLVPLQDSVHAFWKITSSSQFPNYWSTAPKSPEQVKSQTPPHAAVRVVNLGVGAASSVTAKWQLQIDKLLGEIKDYCYAHSIPVVVDINERGWLSIKAPGGTATSLNNDLVCEQDYLLPVPTSPDGWALPFPFALRQLTSLLIYLVASAADQNQVPESFRGAPPFTLDLAYRDLAGDTYTKTFSGKLRLHMWSASVPDEGSEAFFGRWEWEEIDRHGA
jgi:hypothetical protein